LEDAFVVHGIELPGPVYSLMVSAERTNEDERFTFCLGEWGSAVKNSCGLHDLNHLLAAGADAIEVL
jgi:hypothetical protein